MNEDKKNVGDVGDGNHAKTASKHHRGKKKKRHRKHKHRTHSSSSKNKDIVTESRVCRESGGAGDAKNQVNMDSHEMQPRRPCKAVETREIQDIDAGIKASCTIASASQNAMHADQIKEQQLLETGRPQPHVGSRGSPTHAANSVNRTAPDYQQSAERVYPGAVAVKGMNADSLADDDSFTFTAPPDEIEEEPESPVLTATLVPAFEDVGNLQAQLCKRDEILQQRDQQLQNVLLERDIGVAEVIAQDKAAPLRAICSLKGQGFPHGLAEALALNVTAFGLRIWVLDNSGSMSAADGARLVETNDNCKLQHVNCTRWNELQATVKYHAEMAALLRAPTVFRLLNDPGKVHGPQQFSVAERGEDVIDKDMQVALKCMESTPSSSTPLSDNVREIREMIRKLEPALKRDSTKVAVIITSDGLPTSTNKGISPKQEFVEELRSLEGLPVWIVIRLCTNDSQVMNFYNKLDVQLELSVEVLDDFEMESREIFKHNKFLNYAMPLHRCREMGYYHRVFDFLDERKLTKDELRDLFTLLFGQQHMAGLPSPHTDWKGFVDGISTIVENEQHQWNPITRKMEPWVDIKKLNQAYGKREKGISFRGRGRGLSLRRQRL